MTSANQRFKSLMEKPVVATFSSFSKDGYPHMVPLWLVEHNNKLYFSAYDNGTKIRNIQFNSKSGISVVDPSGGPYFSVYGNAKLKDKNLDDYKKIVTKIVEKYIPKDSFEAGMDERMNHPNRILVEFIIEKVY